MIFENPKRSRQAINFTTNVPKVLDLKSSSEQTFHLISNQNFRNFGLNEKCPGPPPGLFYLSEKGTNTAGILKELCHEFSQIRSLQNAR